MEPSSPSRQPEPAPRREVPRRRELPRRRHPGQTVIALGGIALALLAWRVDATNRLAEPRRAAPTSARLRVDLNQASVEELMLLPGIGPALARRIVEHRQSLGAFESLAALDEVHGIGPAKIRTAAPYLTVAAEREEAGQSGEQEAGG